MTLTKIRKRDGRLAEFNEEKIARAIEKAFNATYKPGRGEEARKLAAEGIELIEVCGAFGPEGAAAVAQAAGDNRVGINFA